MAGGDRSQKTEKPTPKRRREAREKGQIARTPELTVWTAMLIVSQLVKSTVARGARTFTAMFSDMALAAAHPDQGGASRFAANAAKSGALLIAPFLVTLMVVAIVVNIA